MAYSTSTHTVTSSQVTSKTFTLGFDFMRAAHVSATVNAVANTDFTIDAASGVLTFGASTALEALQVVVLTRVTPAAKSGRIIDFADGSILSQNALDESALQNLYISQESLDNAATALATATAAGAQFTHATSGTNDDGTVPAPTPAEVIAQNYLRSDGTWQDPPGSGGGGGGSSTFVGLSDTPSVFASNSADASKFVKVDSVGTALEFTSFIGDLDAINNVKSDVPSDGDALVFSSGPEAGWGPTPTIASDIATAATPYAAGKLLVADGTQYTPLAKGTTDHVLTAQAGGLAWAAAPSGGFRGALHRYGPGITAAGGGPVTWDTAHSLTGPFTVEAGKIGAADAPALNGAIQVDAAGYYSFTIIVGVDNREVGGDDDFTLITYYRATDGTTTTPSTAAGSTTVNIAGGKEGSLTLSFVYNMALNSALIVGVSSGAVFNYEAAKSTITAIAL